MSRRSFFSIAVAGSSVVALAAATLAASPASAATTNELLVEDTFSRTVAQGFGAASTGGSYTTAEPKNMSVNGSQGVLSLTQTMTRSALVGPSSSADVDVTNSFGVSALPTAGSVYQGQMVRANSAGAYYTSRLRIMPDKKIYLGLRAVAAGGAQTSIGSDVTLPFSMAAGTRLISRFQVQGSTLRVKAWAKGTSEPASWQLTGSSTALPNGGRSGIWSYLGGGTNSMDVTVDDLRVESLTPANVLPTAAFTSSVNDLALAVDAGGSADSDGTLASYVWDFGDGTTGTGKTATKTYAAPGVYNVKLTVTDNVGGTATVTKPVTAIAPNVLPTAAFTESVNDLALAVDAGGSADSDGTLSSYAWDFGDGTTGTGKTATKTYAAPGVYNVKLTVTDNVGGTATVTKPVTAIAPNVLPTAAFTSSVNDLALAVDAGGSADSDGTLASYVWDFGDGTTGTGKTATKTYAAPGVYNVKLTVTDNRNGTATVTKSVTAIAPNVLPTAAFTEFVSDLAVIFDAGGSSDSDGTLTDYAWDFGDGTSGSGKTVSKLYTTPGLHSVKLTVTDNRGGKTTATRDVTTIAPNVLPTASFTSSVNDLALAVDASGSSDPDGTLSSYAWDFGDGTTGTGKTASRTYAAPGDYNVKLTVTDNRNGTATITNSVTAIAPNVLPTASFTSSVNDLALAVDASGSSDPDGTLSSYAWDFGDGTTGTGKTASRTYAAPGDYNVKLTVTDNRNGTATITKSVTAVAPNVVPTAAFTSSVTNLATSLDASTSTDSDGTIASYAWDFGDGTSGTGKTASKNYTAAGTFAVKLTVTDNRGGTATVTKQVTTTNPAPVRPDATNTGVPAGTALSVYNGDMTITTAGTVIDGLDIRGYVVVKAPNVTIKRSVIRGGAAPTVGKGLLSIVQTGASNFLVEDVTVVPTNPNPYINGINVNQAGTFRRVNISGSVDGIMIYGSGVNVVNSYIHDLTHFTSDPNWGGGPSHDDSIQVQGGTGIKITNNTLKGAYNSAVMITQDAGITKDLWINDNWIDGGGCSLNYGSAGARKTGMQANNNRFGRAQRVAGCAIIHNAAMSDLVPTGNVWDDNGQPAGIKKGS